MPEYKLIALDLDGTLLTSDKVLTDENRRALTRAAEAGVEIVPATGRFYEGMPECIRSLPFVHYGITINGAQVWDVRKQQAVCKAEIPYKRAVEVLTYLDALPVIYDCYMDNWGWMTQSMYDRAAEFAPSVHVLENIRMLRKPVPELKAHILDTKHDIQKLQMFFKDMDLRLRTIPDLKERFPDLSVTTAIVNNIEINSLQAQKGNALAALAEHLHLDMAGTVAFGDDYNDESILKKAGVGVEMANAPEAIRKIADRVTGSCDESGVAQEIYRLMPELR
ncbi:MAG: HAD family phosphatase [Clostridia bacterium]|nr:HAD family phosphatase [Clostridia bacterium]